MAASAAPVAVDPHFLDDDTDSAVGSIDDQVSSFTTSLSSSITAYPIQNGRRYHAYKDGSYYLPNDEEEQDRLDLMHATAKKLTGEKLFFTPLPKDFSGKVLDIGTGTGIWSIEMGDLFPEAQILGNDLSPVQPSWVPPNVKFEVDDVESPWTYAEPFDFIFCRYMCSTLLDWPKLVQSTYDNVKPGGWVEFQDYRSIFYSDDGSLTENHALYQWVKILIDTVDKKLGRRSDPGPHLEEWVRDAGFKNIHHEVFKLPIGPWPKEKRLKEAGLFNLLQILDGLEAFSLRIMVTILGWEVDEMKVLLAKVRKDLKDKSIHAMFDYHVVWAQRPEE